MTFILYQQCHPVPRGQEWAANLVEVGEIIAPSAEMAIAEAKKMTVFRCGRGLGRFPIVKELV